MQIECQVQLYSIGRYNNIIHQHSIDSPREFLVALVALQQSEFTVKQWIILRTGSCALIGLCFFALVILRWWVSLIRQCHATMPVQMTIALITITFNSNFEDTSTMLWPQNFVHYSVILTMRQAGLSFSDDWVIPSEVKPTWKVDTCLRFLQNLVHT